MHPGRFLPRLINTLREWPFVLGSLAGSYYGWYHFFPSYFPWDLIVFLLAFLVLCFVFDRIPSLQPKGRDPTPLIDNEHVRPANEKLQSRPEKQ